MSGYAATTSVSVDDYQLTAFRAMPSSDLEIGFDLSHQLPFGFWEPGRWAIQFADAGILDEPIPCRGRQGVWRIPADVSERIREAV